METPKTFIGTIVSTGLDLGRLTFEVVGNVTRHTTRNGDPTTIEVSTVHRLYVTDNPENRTAYYIGREVELTIVLK